MSDGEDGLTAGGVDPATSPTADMAAILRDIRESQKS